MLTTSAKIARLADTLGMNIHKLILTQLGRALRAANPGRRIWSDHKNVWSYNEEIGDDLILAGFAVDPVDGEDFGVFGPEIEDIVPYWFDLNDPRFSEQVADRLRQYGHELPDDWLDRDEDD